MYKLFLFSYNGIVWIFGNELKILLNDKMINDGNLIKIIYLLKKIMVFVIFFVFSINK